MKKIQILVSGFLSLAMTSFASSATIVGAVYNLADGNRHDGDNGVSARLGVREEYYTGFDTSNFDDLYYGLAQLDYGPARAALDGIHDSARPLLLSSLVGNTATGVLACSTIFETAITSVGSINILNPVHYPYSKIHP